MYFSVGEEKNSSLTDGLAELWHNSDSKDAEPQINWLTLLGEQQNTSKLRGQYSFPIYILATLGLSITFIKSPNSRTGDWQDCCITMKAYGLRIYHTRRQLNNNAPCIRRPDNVNYQFVDTDSYRSPSYMTNAGE